MNRVMHLAVAAVALAHFTCAMLCHAEDLITLTTGEVVKCTIRRETDEQFEVEVANDERTIFNKRVITKSEVKSVVRETLEQRARREQLDAYQQTQKYRLGDASHPFAYYSQTVNSVFRKFLRLYPNAPEAAEVAAKIEEWEAEQAQVAKGQIKYRGQWFTGAEAKRIANVIRAEQLVQDGTALLGKGEFEAAIWKYRAVLYLKDHLELPPVQQACEMLDECYRGWTRALQDRRSQIRIELDGCAADRQLLERQRSEAQASLRAIQSRSENPSEYSPPRLGDVAAATHLRRQLRGLEAALAGNAASQTRLRSEDSSITSRLREIATAQSRLETEKLEAIHAVKRRKPGK